MSDKLHPPRIQWLVEPTYDDDGVQRSAGIDQFGREHGDPIPLRPPVGLSVSEGDELHSAIKRLLVVERAKFQAAIEAENFESEEEANDFLTDDDLFPPGSEPWEDIHEFPEVPPREGGRSPTLAGEAPNGKNRGPEEPTSHSPSPTSGTGSGGSSGLPVEKKVETPTAGGRPLER